MRPARANRGRIPWTFYSPSRRGLPSCQPRHRQDGLTFFFDSHERGNLPHDELDGRNFELRDHLLVDGGNLVVLHLEVPVLDALGEHPGDLVELFDVGSLLHVLELRHEAVGKTGGDLYPVAVANVDGGEFVLVYEAVCHRDLG